MTSTARLPTEKILRSWLADVDITLFCGHWEHGGVMELLPRGGAWLSGPRYDAPFEGLRELRLEAGAHHVHLDLRRLTRAWYVIAPSVCYGFRPSFEIRFTIENVDPRERFGFGLALAHPYADGILRTEPVRRYFRRAAEHMQRFPAAVSFLCDRPTPSENAPSEWDGIGSMLAELERASEDSVNLLRTAFRLPGVAVAGHV